ncbi:MAG: tyrosine-protein phosphatase [Bacteroidota bacterium]|nr:tyrosine-protein phosphatase [Bacteroidota bacterium]
MIKWKKLYRSADISRLTNVDLETLQQRNITNVID